MTTWNWITLGIMAVVGYGTLKVYFNDLKHINKDIEEIKKRMTNNDDKMWKKLEENAERISKIEGRLNGRH